MNEAKWLASEEPQPLLEYILDSSQRKLRLLAASCCRRVWDILTDDRSRQAVEASERFADSRGAERKRMSKELTQIRRGAKQAVSAATEQPLELLGGGGTEAAAAARDTVEPVVALENLERILRSTREARKWRAWVSWQSTQGEMVRRTRERAWAKLTAEVLKAESIDQCRRLRDIFGNPFRPVPFSPSWRTSTAVALAAQMYESREFSAMPILGDALQDAGCDSADVLDHCRGEGPHVRGCWVVDLVLGKE